MMADGVRDIVLREMAPDELILVETIHATAFGRDEEARLPHAIISAGHDVISVVAVDGDIPFSFRKCRLKFERLEKPTS